MTQEDKQKLHQETMAALQLLWEMRKSKYLKQHENIEGIRSSQISCLVDYLIEQGVITPKIYRKISS